tara:strand:- start:107 stop:1471 length:1365 start_codon:yes stop_codon:yes gene_type:complete
VIENIVFLLIDNLRSDQVYGPNKKSITPNLDALVKKGVYFSNAYSSADGTNLSLNCIFNSLFPCRTGNSINRIVLNKENIFESLKRNNFNIYGLVPKIKNFDSIINLFENNNNTYNFIEDPELLSTGLIDEVLDILKLADNETPSFFYFHLMDIHPDKDGVYSDVVTDSDNKEISNSSYIKNITNVDKFLGKIFNVIDYSKTILVLSSDHGDRIPYENIKNEDLVPDLKLAKKIGTQILPKELEKSGGKMLNRLKKVIGEKRIERSKKKLTSHQSRSRDSYFIQSLFDEMLNVPILFVSESIKPKIISKFVSHVDIYPTLCDLNQIQKPQKCDGRSLIPLMNNENVKEQPVYLHTMPYEKPSLTDSVGIRTSTMKYFRSDTDNEKNIHLYDLEKDPLENMNIFEKYPDKVLHFEEIIKKIENDEIQKSIELISDEINKDEESLVKEELRKLGYL